jgi:transaldolase
MHVMFVSKHPKSPKTKTIVTMTLLMRRIWIYLSIVSLFVDIVPAFSPEIRGDCRFFLDTADTREWEQFLPTGIFHGITTNPTLLERANEPCNASNIHRLSRMALSMSDEFMCQAWGETSKHLYDCGMSLTEPARDRIVVKVPVTEVGVQAASKLIQSGCRVCLTACCNRKQALIAAAVGAEYLAPYLGRMADAGKNGIEECLAMQEIVTGLHSDTRILVASLRDAVTMAELATSEMDTFTFSPEVARDLFLEPLTSDSASIFEKAAAANP